MSFSPISYSPISPRTLSTPLDLRSPDLRVYEAAGFAEICELNKTLTRWLEIAKDYKTESETLLSKEISASGSISTMLKGDITYMLESLPEFASPAGAPPKSADQMILEYLLKFDTSFVVSKDTKGVIQAIGEVNTEGNELTYLVTNPLNLLNRYYSIQTCGGGSSIITYLANKTVSLGLSSLTVKSTGTATGFYEKQGFEVLHRPSPIRLQKGRQLISMELTAEKIRLRITPPAAKFSDC